MTTVADVRREAEQREQRKIRLYNPDTKDFRCSYSGEEYLIRANDSAEFKENVGLHIKKHLTDYLLNKRGCRNLGEMVNAINEIQKEIEINI